MTLDISKIREGDEVTVRANVLGITGGGFNLEAGFERPIFWAPSESIATHTPRPINAGDRVVWLANTYSKWAVIDVRDGQAWLRSCDDALWHTAPVSELRLVGDAL